MDKAKFRRLMELNEGIKRKRKALREWQERQDMNSVEQDRYCRVRRKQANCI
ncbi:MAG: hypothetical protein ABFD25_00835 [Clostridiaceae bacterium]